MKVAFFHGLESPHKSKKNKILDRLFGDTNVYAPAMDYHNPELYNEVLKHLEQQPVNLLVGSSMGGYFAQSLSTLVNTQTLLFNPAIHSRSFEPENVVIGQNRPFQFFVLGKTDTVVNPLKTIDCILQNEYKYPTELAIEIMEHRIPSTVFEKYIFKYTN